MSCPHYKKLNLLPAIRAFLLYLTMVFLFDLLFSKTGLLELHPENTFMKILISSFTFSILSFPLLYLLYFCCMIFFPWIKDRRSKKNDLIPLQTCRSENSSPITPVTQPSHKNLPPPLSEQDPSFLRTVDQSNLKDISRPFVFLEVSEISEGTECPRLFELVEVPQPFELVDVSLFSISLILFSQSLNRFLIFQTNHRSLSKTPILKAILWILSFDEPSS
ncbi:hypothetical protein DFH28DRAFT_959576 [Melampsora americana]|nr:hypothetical protein DFH28DRAFT_959576 [Melampsora americana]